MGELKGGQSGRWALRPPPACCATSPWLLYILFFHVFTRKGNKIALKGNNVHPMVRAEGPCDPGNVYLMPGYLGRPGAMYLVPGHLGCPRACV